MSRVLVLAVLLAGCGGSNDSPDGGTTLPDGGGLGTPDAMVQVGTCDDGTCQPGETCATCRADCCTESGPIVATDGMTISGLHVTNPDGICIDLGDATNVTIEDSEIGPCKDPGISSFGATDITIRRNFIHEAAGGVYLTNTDQGNLIVEHNRFLNVVGPLPRGQYVQLNGVHGPGVRISCNVGEQDPLMGGTKEDSYSVFDSGGTAGSPLLVQYNKARGGTGQSGCGIVMGDGDGEYTSAIGNIIVQPGGCGIGIAGGHDQIMENNLIFSPETPISNVGVVVWDQYDSNCHAIRLTNNQVNWTLGNPSNGTPGEPNAIFDGANCGTIADYETNDFAAPIDATIFDRDIPECDP